MSPLAQLATPFLLAWVLDPLRRGRQPRDGTHLPARNARRDRDANVLRRTGNDLGIHARDVDTLGLVLVRRGDDLDDLVAGEVEEGNVHCGAVHQVGVKNTEDGLVSHDQKIAALALELEDDGLQAHGEVVV